MFAAGSFVSSVRSHGRGPTSDKKRLLIRRDQDPERCRGTSPAATGRRRPSASPGARLRENQHCPRRMPDPQPRGLLAGIDPRPVVRADGYTVDHLCGAKRTPRALCRPKKGQRKKTSGFHYSEHSDAFPSHTLSHACVRTKEITLRVDHAVSCLISHTHVLHLTLTLSGFFHQAKTWNSIKLEIGPKFPSWWGDGGDVAPFVFLTSGS